jgi:hypothetical protein
MNSALYLELRNEYTEYLVDVLRAFIYEGLKAIYNQSVDLAMKTKKDNGILLIYQSFLQSIHNWNTNRIIEETNRIRQESRMNTDLDDLVRAVVRSNILLLTHSNTMSNVIANNFYDNFQTETYIHQCYIECGKEIYNNPYLYLDKDVTEMEYKRNQIVIQSKIREGIVRAVRKVIPLSLILKEFLHNTMDIFPNPMVIEIVGDKRSTVACNRNSCDVDQNDPGKIAILPSVKADDRQNILMENDLFTASKPNSDAKKTVSEALERAVAGMLGRENRKSDMEKIKDLVQIDEMLSSTRQKSQPEGNVHMAANTVQGHDSKQKIRTRISDDKKERKTSKKHNGMSLDSRQRKSPPKMIGDLYGSSTSRSAKPGTNYDDQQSQSINEGNVSFTQNAIPSASNRHNSQITERNDPSRTRYIEQYGFPTDKP